MAKEKCGGCDFNVNPVITFEHGKRTNRKWAVKRCPRESCKFAGWPDYPKSYDEYTEDRAYKINEDRKKERVDRRNLREDNGGWMGGV